MCSPNSAVSASMRPVLSIISINPPLVAALKIGVLRYRDSKGSEKRVAVSGGFMEIIDNTGRILAETAELGEHMDNLLW
jgi:F-type H+-transporting ATPase subunit epsilon